MTKDEALKLAWDALEDIGDEWGFTSQRTVPKRKEALTAIKEALANEALEKMAENARELGLDYEPEQEPVGEIVDAIEGAFKCSFTKMLPVGTKLYATPPQRKPLTDEEINAMFSEALKGNKLVAYVARAIEAAHGIKEKNT